MRAVRTAAGALAVVMGLSGCGRFAGDPEVQAAFTEQFVPVVLEVARDMPIADPRVKAVVFVGTFVLEKYLDGRANKEFESDDDTVLTVRQTIDGEVRVTVLRIKSDRKLRIEMDGKFVQTVEKDRIEIVAEPGSTIVITDAADSDVIHQAGTAWLAFPDADEGDTHIDLDTGETKRGNGPGMDMRIEYRTFQPSGPAGANGARIARWKDGQPNRAACAELPASRWREIPEMSWLTEKVTYCLRTGEGRYGVFTFTTNVIQGFEYIVWKNPEE
ncbi:hypothetical protein [Actinocorallia sp. A-T 12471]|uniref:hypothetical protein n=1 Tax=Actinocorallia sp. A-T 12471 TaxID=3089813 RepID=UPI0029D3EBDF|nr:hypothetical protein [Actinocorallia sp. A-T 12471]MDX6740161.1 hypothetical protein [Actinocorallia sp. A-T 12471]